MQDTLERLRQRKANGEGGFTLIELLIVIVILGILAAIVVFAVQNLTTSSATSACNADQKTVETAAEAYKAQVGVYPGATTPTGVALAPASAGTNAGVRALLGTATVSGTTYGPWLKDNPTNGNHYQMYLLNDGSGTVTPYNFAATPAAITCSSVS